MAEFEDLDGGEEWDDAFAEALIGKTLLVGLTFLDADEHLIERQQVFGTVEICDPLDGISIRDHRTSELFTIAPILGAIEYGDPGIYQLSDTDEIVENPDFTARLTIIKPRQN